MGRVLFIANLDKGSDYARYKVLARLLHPIEVDIVYLNVEFICNTWPEVIFRQAGVDYLIEKYDVIVFWPRSLHYPADRAGNWLSMVEPLAERCWSTLEEGLMLSLQQERLLNKYQSVRSASNKLSVSRIATLANIRQPVTNITNDPRAIEKKIDGHELIIKLITDSNKIDAEHTLYPTRATGQNAGEDFALVPVVVQEFVRSSLEMRVYHFGGLVRTFVVPKNPDQEHVDVRLQYQDRLETTMIENSEVEKIARKISELFDLNVFSFDILDFKNELYLLDLNPLGTWYWLNEEHVSLLDRDFACYLKGRVG